MAESSVELLPDVRATQSEVARRQGEGHFMSVEVMFSQSCERSIMFFTVSQTNYTYMKG